MLLSKVPICTQICTLPTDSEKRRRAEPPAQEVGIAARITSGAQSDTSRRDWPLHLCPSGPLPTGGYCVLETVMNQGSSRHPCLTQRHSVHSGRFHDNYSGPFKCFSTGIFSPAGHGPTIMFVCVQGPKNTQPPPSHIHINGYRYRLGKPRPFLPLTV